MLRTGNWRWVKSHLCAFLSLVLSRSSTTLRHCRGHRVLLQIVTFSYFNTGMAIPLLPVTLLLSLTVQFPLPSSTTKRGNLLPLHSLECCRIAEACSHEAHPAPGSPGADGTGLLTLDLILREKKAVPILFLALQRKHKQQQSETTLLHSATNKAKHSLPRRKATPC